MKTGRPLAIGVMSLVMASLSFVVSHFLLWMFFREGGFRVYGGWFTWQAFMEGLFFAWPLWWAVVAVARHLRPVMGILYGVLLGFAGVALHYFLLQQQSSDGQTIWLSDYRFTALLVLWTGIAIALLVTGVRAKLVVAKSV